MNDQQKFIAKVLRDCATRAMLSSPESRHTQIATIAVIAGMFVYHFEQEGIPIDDKAFRIACQPQ